jgi:hypothetical protein
LVFLGGKWQRLPGFKAHGGWNFGLRHLLCMKTVFPFKTSLQPAEPFFMKVLMTEKSFSERQILN